MITPQLTLGLHREIFIDNFAGGGGASTGIERGLGRYVDAALNHNREALAMHRMNHPQTRHYCEDILTADPVKIAAGRPVGGIWFSPDCKHFSKAKGGKPRSKKIRGLAWVVIHWINKVSPRMIFLENVEEFQTWCPLDKHNQPSKWRKGWFFDCFVGALRRRGYVVDHREIRACDAGAPTIRKRFYLMARRDGQPIVWPEASHGPTAKKPHRMIAECLDFSLPCPSIFLEKVEARKNWNAVRPLADSTMARVAKGVDRYVLKSKRPFLVSLTHQGGDRVESVDEPIRTVTASKKDQNQLVAVHLTKFNTGAVGKAVDEPGPTVTANSFVKRPGGAAPLGVVAASVVKMRGTNVGHPVDEPGHTISAQGTHHAVSAVYLAQHNGGEKGHQTIGHPADKPLSTINSKGSQQQVVAASLIKYYGTDQDPRMDEPCHVVTTRDRFGLVEAHGVIPPLTPELEAGARLVAKFLRDHGVVFEGEYAMVGEYVIVDIGMRMLKPRELYRAQGFPENYIIDRGLDERPDGTLVEIPLTGTAQVRMCGNSVCPPVAEALVAANLPDMRVHEFAA